MIPILVQNGTPFIWNASDWLMLREEHKIVGSLVGCLAGLPRQEAFKGLPAALLQEEVSLLLEMNLAYIVDDRTLSKLPTLESREKYFSYKERNQKEQAVYYEEQRKEQISSMIDRIVDGKRRKLLGLNTKKSTLDINVKAEEITPSEIELDRDKILKTELEKSSAASNPPLLVHTFTSDPWQCTAENKNDEWTFPATEAEQLKYSVFKDLWNKRFYITEGHKFGVDYLVYPGDPVKFHAQFLVVCMEYRRNFTTVDLSTFTRLGSISRKTFVIATKPPNGDNIVYQSIQWLEKN